MGIRRRMAFLVLGMVMCQICTGCGQKVPDSGGAAGQGKSVLYYGIRAEYVSEPRDSEDDEWVQEILKTPDITQQPVATPVATQASGEIRQPGKEGTTTIPTVTQSPVEKETSVAPMMTQQPVATQSGAEEENMNPENAQAPVEIRQPAEIEPVPTETQQPIEKEEVETPMLTQAPVVSQPTAKPAATAAPTAYPAPVVHIHTLVTESKEAACLSEGSRKEYCESCGEVIWEETIPAKGHDFVKSVWELPTCMKGGYYNNICNRCGQVECVTQKPLPHEVEDILVQEGNCMEDTVIQHVCKLCGIKVKSDTRYTPYDIHAWTTAIVDGAELTYCERCGVAR